MHGVWPARSPGLATCIVCPIHIADPMASSLFTGSTRELAGNSEEGLRVRGFRVLREAASAVPGVFFKKETEEYAGRR